jgi:hypothetical protein
MELRESPYFLLQHLHECLTKTNARDSWQLLFEQTMSFGWKLVSSDETTLAVNRGPEWGPPGSFRAEAYGMLSAVLCVQHIMLYCNVTDSFTMKLVTDNKGLLIRCQQRKQYPDSFPTATLASDWDVVEQIVSLLRQSSINPFFGHVLGHQDDHTAYNQLNLIYSGKPITSTAGTKTSVQPSAIANTRQNNYKSLPQQYSICCCHPQYPQATTDGSLNHRRELSTSR